MAQGGDDQDIFESATAPDPSSSDPTGPIIEERSPADRAVSDAIQDMGRTRDRFQVTQRPGPQGPPQPQQDAAEPEDRSVAGLMQAMLNERDRRQSAERERDQVRQFVEERRRQEEANKTPLSQRLFEDPDGVINELRDQIVQPFEQKIAQLTVQHDFSLASLRHQEVWGDAWNAWYQQVGTGQDPVTYFAIMNSPSPGEALVAWYREHSFRSEIGDDPEAYKQRIIEEYLSGQPSRSSDGRFAPRPQAPRLPTATSRIGSSGNGLSGGAEDGSEASIFAAGRPERRR